MLFWSTIDSAYWTTQHTLLSVRSFNVAYSERKWSLFSPALFRDMCAAMRLGRGHAPSVLTVCHGRQRALAMESIGAAQCVYC